MGAVGSASSRGEAVGFLFVAAAVGSASNRRGATALPFPLSPDGDAAASKAMTDIAGVAAVLSGERFRPSAARRTRRSTGDPCPAGCASANRRCGRPGQQNRRSRPPGKRVNRRAAVSALGRRARLSPVLPRSVPAAEGFERGIRGKPQLFADLAVGHMPLPGSGGSASSVPGSCPAFLSEVMKKRRPKPPHSSQSPVIPQPEKTPRIPSPPCPQFPMRASRLERWPHRESAARRTPA